MDQSHAVPTIRLRKSRTGCNTCKARRIKCDEAKPACGNCCRRFIGIASCEYSKAPPRLPSRPRKKTRQNSAGIYELDHDNAADQAPPLPLGRNPEHRPVTLSDTSQWRSLELRLMHHYTSIVSKTLPDCKGKSAEALWQQIIPHMAFDSEVVLNPMLAFSALHLHLHLHAASDDDSRMSWAISRYLDRTLSNHREALQLFDHQQQLTEPVWVSAVIMSNMYWLIAHQARPDEPYELPKQSWTITEGVSLLFTKKQALLHRLGYRWFGYESRLPILADSELPPRSVEQLRGIQRDMADLFEHFAVHNMPKPKKQAYDEPRDLILQYYRAYFSGAATKVLRRYVGTMPNRCRPLYRALLEEHDALAMALFARLTVLLKGLQEAWWMNGKRDYEVVERDVRGVCALMPPQCMWTMEWPCRVLEGELVLDREVPEEDAEVPEYVSWGLGVWGR